MNILDVVVGKPIKTSDERAEQIGAAQGIPIFGLDALSSAAYGPEAALMIVITIVNLRGVRDAGLTFAVPTYLFVGTLMITLITGVLRVFLSGGHLTPAAPLPAPPPMTSAVSAWLLLRAFASGCTALTGVEAVSNGVKAFREPAVKNAERTLTVIIVLLAALLAGISYLVKAYGIVATDPGQPGYQSLLSMLVAAVFGKGLFYYLTVASILFVLSLSANTAFADFPRLCRAVAQNNYLPHAFGYRGRRLVYTYGIVVLAVLCGGLLILFGGVTDRLIPLFAVGAFLAFTLSQCGMVAHWLKNRGTQWMKSALVNGIGALVTGITVVVVLVAKFAEGAWITLLFIPLTIVFFVVVRRHYHSVKVITTCRVPVQAVSPSERPLVIIPIDRWSNITRQGIEFASRLSPEVIALHVEPGEHSELLQEDWERYVEEPFRTAGKEPPTLQVLPSPYRFIIIPIVQFVLDLSKKHPDRSIIVVIPELVEDRWYEYFLHNQRGRLLEWVLLARGNDRVFTVTAPWYAGAAV
jgi:amino acid transporter